MNKREPFVVTISREVGSGGHTVGSILAEKLNVRYLDKQLTQALEKQFQLSAEEIEKLKGKKKNWLSDFVDKVAPVPTAKALGLDPQYTEEAKVRVTTDEIFATEVQILRGFAQMGSCVIAGRSGFHVFKDHPNTFNVFISATLPHRIRRVMDRQGLSEGQAADLISVIDQARENYIMRYAGVSRYDARNYDLTLKADGFSEEELASIIFSCL